MFAEYERELISARTSAALRSLPRERRGGSVYSDDVIAVARDLRESGHSYHSIAMRLEADGVAPPRGHRIHGSSVRRLLTGS